MGNPVGPTWFNTVQSMRPVFHARPAPRSDGFATTTAISREVDFSTSGADCSVLFLGGFPYMVVEAGAGGFLI